MKIYTKTGDQMTTGLLDGTRVSKHDVRIHLLGNIDELNSMLGVVKSLTKDPLQVNELSAIQRTLMKLMAGIAEISEVRKPEADSSKKGSDSWHTEESTQQSENVSSAPLTQSGSDSGFSIQNMMVTDTPAQAKADRQDPLITHRKYPIAAEDIAYLEMRIDQMEAAFDREKDFVLPGGSFYSAQIDVARTVTRRCERWFAEAVEEYPLDQEAARYLNRLSDYLYVLARYADASDCEKTSSVPGTEPFTGMDSASQQTCKLTEDIAQEAVDSLHKKFNHSYDTFYTFCVCDAEGGQLATNALEHHSVALSEAQRAAAAALARAARKGCSDSKAAAVPENGGAALYIHEQLVGSVGVYGAYKKDTNEKANLLLDEIRNTLGVQKSEARL